MTVLFGQITHKQNFVNGWTRYVKPFMGAPPPDFYWNPRAGGWYTYPATHHDIRDKDWPRTDLSGFVTAGSTYDHITAQYARLTQTDQPYAMWDPRRGQWMSVSQKGDTSAKVAALGQLLQDVVELHNRGFLGLHTTDEIVSLIRNEM